MTIEGKTIGTFIAGISCTVAGPWIVWNGWRRFREGRITNIWFEHDRVLLYFNDLNDLLGRPHQKRLTVRQIRVVGVFYMTLGVVVFGGGIFMLSRLIQ
jgi:hypothetical protein